MNSRPRRQILFLGTHGQFNVGDELLLETFLAQLGSEHSYDVNSYAPSETAEQLGDTYDVAVFDTAATRFGLFGRLRRADAVVFGGGSIVKELYASTGRWRYATLCMVLAIVVTARVVRTPVLLSNVGVGPIRHRFGRLLAGSIVRLASRVSVRDQGSLDTCRSFAGRRDNVRLVPDAVWANERLDLVDSASDRPVAAGEDTAGTAPRALRLALNVNRDIENGDQWEPFLGLLADALRLVAERRPVELHGLPMQCRFKEHTDLDELDGLFESLADVDGLRTIRHTPEDHRDVAEVIERCDVVVSERLHAIVMAAVLGRAVVGLPYDVKVRELVDQLDLNDRSFDVNTPFDPEELAAAVIATGDESVAEGRRLSLLADTRRAEARAYFDEVRSWLIDPDRRGWPSANAG